MKLPDLLLLPSLHVLACNTCTCSKGETAVAMVKAQNSGKAGYVANMAAKRCVMQQPRQLLGSP